MERLVRTGLLYDFYGGLLTEKQRKAMELYYLEDWSLAEIASAEAVSRQAIHDLLHRSERLMEEYESKLGLMERFRRQQTELDAVNVQLEQMLLKLAGHSQVRRELSEIKAKIAKLIENEQEQ
jgi:predicted DNA-binding protein YlxM (UPF0122 family)